MTIIVRAEKVGGTQTAYKADRFRIIHSVLYREPGGQLLARHEGLHWYTPETLQLRRMEFVGPLHLTFLDKEGNTRHFGPLEQIDVVDGDLYFRDRLLAKLAEHGWCVDADDRCFGQLVFKSAMLS